MNEVEQRIMEYVQRQEDRALRRQEQERRSIRDMVERRIKAALALTALVATAMYIPGREKEWLSILGTAVIVRVMLEVVDSIDLAGDQLAGWWRQRQERKYLEELAREESAKETGDETDG